MNLWIKYLIYTYAIVITVFLCYTLKKSSQTLDDIDSNVTMIVYNAYLSGCLDNLKLNQNKSGVCYESALQYSEPIKNIYK